jgi:hypothetical protein
MLNQDYLTAAEAFSSTKLVQTLTALLISKKKDLAKRDA